MKKHFLSLFEPKNRKWTISLFIISVILIISGNFVGITDNLPGISIVFFGMVFFFFGLVHSWQKPAAYLILAGICFGTIVLIVLLIYAYAAIFTNSGLPVASGKADGIIEAFALLTTIFICAPGIVAGLLGAFIRTILKNQQIN